MKKVFLAVLLILVISASSLAESKPVEVVIWHEKEPGVVSVLEEKFKQLEPGIKVNLVRKENSNEALKLIASDSNSAPDLYFWAHDKVGLYATMGLLEPLEKWIPAGDFKNFIPMTEKAGIFKNKHYMVPIYFETILFMYNKKLLAEKDVPKTTDGLLAMMKERTKDGFYFYVEQHSTAYYAAAWINGFGGYIINSQSKPGLDNSKTIAAISYHKKFIPYMPKVSDWNTVITLFNEGKAALTLNGPWIIPGARQAGIDLGYASLPVVEKAGKPLSPYAGVQGLMMLKTSKNKAASAKVLKFLLSKEAGEALALAQGSAPAHKQAYLNEKIKGDGLINAMRTVGEAATPMPNVPEMDIMWSTTETALAAINMNDADVKAELKKAQADSLKRIADMK